MARLQIVSGAPDISLDVIVPEYDEATKARGITKEEFLANRSLPVLWLLHGAGGHSSDWLRYTQIELFAQEKGIVVACPSVGRGSFYVNAVKGSPWEDIVTDKLWKLVHSMFPTSDKPEDNTIAGLSMGGYGALRLGLAHPERYGRIGCMSGGVEVPQEYAAGTFVPAEEWGTADAFGDPAKVIGGPNDLYQLAKDRSGSGNLPPIYMCCGTRDEHEAQSNPRFRDYLRSLGYDVTWSEGDYGHEWRFWNIEVEKLLHWLP